VQAVLLLLLPLPYVNENTSIKVVNGSSCMLVVLPSFRWDKPSFYTGVLPIVYMMSAQKMKCF